MQIVHTDNRLITADCDDGNRETRPLVRESVPYLQACSCLTEIKSGLKPHVGALYEDTLADWPWIVTYFQALHFQF
jgi:hypothetical protein